MNEDSHMRPWEDNYDRHCFDSTMTTQTSARFLGNIQFVITVNWCSVSPSVGLTKRIVCRSFLSRRFAPI